MLISNTLVAELNFIGNYQVYLDVSTGLLIESPCGQFSSFLELSLLIAIF